MSRYSRDLRERIVKAVQEGQPVGKVAERFAVSRWTVRRHVTQAEAGQWEARRPPGRKPKLTPQHCEVLRQQLEAHPDWTLEEHAEALAKATAVVIKKSSIANYCKRLGISRKKDTLPKRARCRRPQGLAPTGSHLGSEQAGLSR